MNGGTKLKAWLIMFIFLLVMACTAVAGQIIYVDADAPGANDGSSWADAYNYLQDALADANSGDEIHVAEGIYKPDEDSAYPNGTGSRSATFQLMNGVAVKGRYAGFGQPDPNERNFELYETILSGDLAGNDTEVNDLSDLWDEPTRADNSLHVVTGSGTDATAVLDGFTITGGNANSGASQNMHRMGAGMIVSDGSPTLTDCTFTSNSAEWYGGGMRTDRINFSPTLTNCTFSGNYAGSAGGGMFNGRSSPMLKNCTFIGNLAGAYGGGMYDTGGSELTNCTFIRNSAGWGGGGIANTVSSTSLFNCMFISNSAYYGGVMFTSDTSSVTMTNCTFAANSATLGNAVACNGMGSWGPAWSDLQFTNCILWNSGNEIWINDNSVITIRYSDVQGGQASVYDPCNRLVWGDGNMDADPCFADRNNGDYHLKSQAGGWEPSSQSWVKDEVTSPCIDAGNPMSPIRQEPFPNGGIINMGAYGGTAKASKSYFGEPPCETIVAGDINGDCKVNFLDFSLMALHWLRDENP
ncbi:MAG: hypothetical protein WBC22_01705 [Sedimentisphaerales bacterium]